MKFTYNSGQRPLEGYTLKRGIGRGGFGEVYYAVSDGGKEVALKLVRGNLEVELRGMAQCLNLKHPNLVSLYDIRTDAHGDHWIVMEYLGGEPLNVVISRHPQGLPHELVQQWFAGLARAVGYLHDHGIVHRDLKPGNVFVENGMVKVGDYGLSKFISGSQRTAQTQSVGTVYYMAPEISTGNYNRQIDIYAAGVVLYEMLTGRVPFDGESAGEILMKHLTAPPDLSKLPPEYVSIVGRALAKNPVHRFGTLVEMAQVVESVGKEVKPAIRTTTPQPTPNVVTINRPPRTEAIPVALPAQTVRTQVTQLSAALVLSALIALVSSILWSALSGVDNLNKFGILFFLTVGACWAVLIPAKFWAYRRGDSWYRRVIMMTLGLLIGFGALWLDGWIPNLPAREAVDTGSRASFLPRDIALLRSGTPNMAGYLIYFALAFFALRWWKLADPRRPHRFSFAPVLAAGFWGLVLLLVWRDQDALWRGTIVLTTAAGIIQLVSPWDPPPPPIARRMRLRYA
jgi:serine/threonine protein kinase